MENDCDCGQGVNYTYAPNPRIKELEKRLETADALLGEVEWIDDDHTGTTNCFGCGNMKEEGHASDCELNAYIQEGK